MKKEIWQAWIYYHWFSTFFENFPTWLEEAPRFGPLLSSGEWDRLLKNVGSEETLQEYDDLFKGVNAGVYIPLWASACKSRGDILLDRTTLEVIRFYHKWGFSPAEMDGNPPDFIGQQLRFLEYLSMCLLYRRNAGESVQECEEAMESFESLYVLDTVKTVAEGIKRHSMSPLFCTMANCMLAFFSGDIDGTEQRQKMAEEVLRESSFYFVYQNGRLPRIEDKEEEVVNTAGRNNCGGKCVIQATVREGCVLDLQTDCGESHPQIRACVRGRGYRGTFLNGMRLRYPMKRIGERGEGRFQRISWEEAANIVAVEWTRIRDAYGPGARYVNYSTGVSAVLRPDAMVKRLLNLDGGHLDRYNSYSSACSRYVTPYIYGDTYSGNSIEDVLNTKLLILWGHNPVETIFGSERNYYLAQVKEKGVRVVVIDPRQSDTAVAYADEWVGIKPSTDSALADAMAYVIWQSGLQDQQFMDTFCLGFDEARMPEGIPENQSYQAYLFGLRDGVPKTPQWAEAITGVSAETIERLAKEYATTKPACLLPGLGIQRIGNGEQTVRSLALLTCLTGNVGIPGGNAAGAGEVREHKNPSFPTLTNPFPGRIPSFLWTKAVERGTEMDKRKDGLEGVEKLDTNIKMIVNLAGNTLVNQHSDIHNTIRILKDTSQCEFILCSDVFMTSSAKFADILLPAPSFFEDENIAAPWDFGSYLLYNNRVIEPLFECRFEYELLGEVAGRIGLKEQWEQGHENYAGWLKTLYEDLRKAEPQLPEFTEFKRNGGYRYKDTKPYIAYAEQIRDLAAYPFATPSGKIEIFSPRLYQMNNPEEIPAIPRYVPCPEGPEDPLRSKYPLQMIGWHTKRRCHSIHDNNDWMEEVEPQRVWMHPDDASERGVTDGEQVEVFNNRGKIHIRVHVTQRIIKGVVAIPQGAWYKPDASGVDTRGSINVLTSTRPTPLAKGNPQHTNLVEVTGIERN